MPLKITRHRERWIWRIRTSKEASQFLGLVRMAHTIDEAIVLVRLHPGLDAVKGEGGEGGQDAGGAGGDLGPVSFDEPLLLVGHGVSRPTLVALLAVASAGALRRHGRRLKLGTILWEGDEFSWHAFWQRTGPGGSRL